jgi:hypothetical protein
MVKKYPSELNTVSIRIDRGDYDQLQEIRNKLALFLHGNFSLANVVSSLLSDTEVKYGLNVTEYQLSLLDLWLQPEHSDKRISELDEILRRRYQESKWRTR